MTDAGVDPAVRVVGLDHVVLIVADVEASVQWYRDVLGMAIERLEPWRRGEVPFPSARVDATTIIDLVQGNPNGVNVDHVALVVESVDLGELAASGRLVVEGPPRRLSGARGAGEGLYVRDPDGHRIELRVYR